MSSGRVSSDDTITWQKWGSVVILTILNLVPDGYPQLSPAPVPLAPTYNAIASTDGYISIFSVETDGYIYLRIGDMSKQYTGAIIYLTEV